jgi:hypothetical protein
MPPVTTRQINGISLDLLYFQLQQAIIQQHLGAGFCFFRHVGIVNGDGVGLSAEFF